MKKYFLISFFVVIASLLGYFLFKNDGNSYYKAVEFNGKTMKANVSGTGDKTIVMLSRWRTDSPVDDFYPVYRELSQDYKVVVLEYFGYGSSEVTSDERTNENIVEEIRKALDELGIKPPYILMPQSMSGLYSLYYAEKYPSEVSAIIGMGMSLPQEQLERWNEETFEETKNDESLDKLNISVRNHWNSFYNNSKELGNVRYPEKLPVLAFLGTEQIESVDNMIKSGEMKMPLIEMNKRMITNPEIQSIKVFNGSSDFIYDQVNEIVESSKYFIEHL